jgi:hypothetical protein
MQKRLHLYEKWVILQSNVQNATRLDQILYAETALTISLPKIFITLRFEPNQCHVDGSPNALNWRKMF